MGARIKKVVLKKMSAKDFAALLKKLGACAEARKWAKGKTLQRVWATCDSVAWMRWLLRNMNSYWRPGKSWLTEDEYRNISDLAEAAFSKMKTWKGGYRAELMVFRKYVIVK